MGRRPDGSQLHINLAKITGIAAPILDLRYQESVAPLTISGMGRSGTTLMMALLSQHPSIVVPGGYPFEFREVSYLWHVARVLTSPGDHENSMAPTAFQGRHHWSTGFDPFDKVERRGDADSAMGRWFRSERVAHIIDFTKQQVDGFALAAQAGSSRVPTKYIAEKLHPGALLVFVSAVHPASRTIFLVRDFRDIFCSARAFNQKRGTSEFGEASFTTHAAWLEHMGRGARRVHDYVKTYRDTSIVVRYEDLIEAPSVQLERIFRHLGLDHDSQTVQRAIELGGPLARFEQHGTASDPSKSIGRWRSELADDEHTAASAFVDVLDGFGYERGPAGGDGSAGMPTMQTNAEITEPAAPVRPRASLRREDRRLVTAGAGIEASDVPAPASDIAAADRTMPDAEATTSPPWLPSLASERLRAGMRDPLKAIRTLAHWRSGVLMRLDDPLDGDGLMLGVPFSVEGWAVSRRGHVGQVEISLGERLLATVRPLHERPDVAGKYPGVDSGSSPGFQIWVTPDGIEPGPHELTVTATDDLGGRTSVRLDVVIASPGAVVDPDPAEVPVAQIAGKSVNPLDRSGRSRRQRVLEPSILGSMPPGAVLFIHIPKTAGTAMRHLLDARVPPDSRMYLYPRHPGWAIQQEKFRLLPPDVKAHIRLVYGHFSFGVHEGLLQPMRYITMVREPIDRLISQYYHVKKQQRHPRHGRVTEGQVSLEDFLRDESLAPSNRMVHMISGIQGAKGSDHQDTVLERALENIEKHFAAVLVMEEMERSIVRLGEILGTTLPVPPRTNVSASRPKRESVDPEVIALAREHNRLDVALYEHVKRAFDALPTAASPQDATLDGDDELVAQRSA